MLQFFKVIVRIRSIFEEPDGKGLSVYEVSCFHHQKAHGDAVRRRSMREDGGYLLSEVPLKWSQSSTEFLASFLRIAATKTENDDPTKISFWGLFSLLNLLVGTCPSVRSC